MTDGDQGGAQQAIQPAIRPKTHRIVLENLEIKADIGFHSFEIGAPQRLLVSIDVTLDLALWPKTDRREASWDYDQLRLLVHELVDGRHFNLQETLARQMFERIAARPGVIDLTVWLKKTDVYADAGAVGVVLSSR